MGKIGRDRIKKKYIGVVLAIILSTLLGNAISQHYLFSQEQGVHQLNMMGRQSMLSQRLAKNVTLLKNNDSDSTIRKKIQDDYKEILKNNSSLIDNYREKSGLFIFNNSSEDFKRYLVVDVKSVDKDISCIIDNCTSSNKSMEAVLSFSDNFAIQMENYTSMFLQESKKQTYRMMFIELGLLFLVIFLVGMEFYKIVLPINNILLGKIDELKKKQKFSQKIEEIANVGWWELDVITGETAWSDEVYRIHKLPLGTPTNKVKGIEFYAPHERAKITACVENCISKKERYDDEFEFYDSEGVKKWVRAIGEPILGGDGNVIKLLGIFQDLTQKRNIEKEIRDSKKYLELAVDGANLSIWDWDLLGDKVHFDKKCIKMLGLEDGNIEMNIETWESRIHPEDSAKYFSDIKDYLNGKTKHYENIHRVRHVDGHWLYILDRGKFSDWNSEGQPIRFTGTLLDITESQKLQEELRFILSHAKVGIWKWDIVENNLVWDDSMYELYDIDKGHFNGAYDAWEKTLNPQDKEKAVNDLEEALAGKKAFDTTFSILTGDNNIKYIGGRATIDRDDNGEPIFMYGINWDRTYEQVTQKELAEQKKIAFHNSKLASIGSLAAGVGHEINNPLAIIRGYLSIIRKMSLDGKEIPIKQIEGFAEKIDLAVDRVANIVSGLRAFSRSDFDTKEIFNIGDAVEEYLSMVKEIYGKEGVQITKTGPAFDKDIYISGNRGKIQQVLMNFLSNSKDATSGQNNREVEVCGLVEDGHFKMQVIDNGVGIPDEIRERIFDPFFTTKDIGQGTGIGLSISQGIISEHGGEISCLENAEMTTFEIILPIVEKGEEKNQIIRDNKSVDIKGYRIILVEDEKDIREYISNKLEEFGLVVTTFENGAGAYEEYISNPNSYDIIMSDMKMPIMDGISLLKRIRQNNELKQPKFIVVTGGIDTNFKDSKSELSRLIDGYFLKPFTDEEIKEALFSAIREK